VLVEVRIHDKDGEILKVAYISDVSHGCCRGTARTAVVQSAQQMTSPCMEADGKGVVVSQHPTGEFPGAEQLKIKNRGGAFKKVGEAAQSKARPRGTCMHGYD
jgi:hypothetical protein